MSGEPSTPADPAIEEADMVVGAPRRRSRLRRFLVWGGVVVVLVVVTIVGVVTWAFSRAVTDTTGQLSFDNPLAIPPLLEPTVEPDGTKVFGLGLWAGTTEILEDVTTDTWGVNGTHLGPTLRASRGDEIRIDVTNHLPAATSLHWHGMRLPAVADGGPHQPIDSGAVWSPTWTIDQAAATLWYHPHLHGATADHVYRGLAGMFIIDDDQSIGIDIPSEYGVDDIPLIVQDKRFGSDGNFDHSQPFLSQVGILGDHVLVNGTHDPHLDITTSTVRLRLLNGSNGRVFEFGFDDDREFQQIATDGGFLAEPHPTRRVMLSPGERAEIVVRMEPATTTVLRSYPPDLRSGFFQRRFSGGDDRFDILELRAARDLDDRHSLPERLPNSERPLITEAVVGRSLNLEGSSRINGHKMDMRRIDTVVEAGAVEMWEVTNASGTIHNFHVHDVQFHIVELDGTVPPPAMSGPKDTVFLPPGSTARLLIPFGHHVDPDVPYMYHCHILDHEDNGMMGQFTVVEPGTADRAPTTVDAPPGHDH